MIVKFFLRFIAIIIFSSIAYASSQIAALIGEEVITKNHLHDRYNFFLIENPNVKVKDKSQKRYILQSLLKSLIDEKILFQELDKKGITVSQEEINNGVSYLEERQKIPQGQFFNHLKKKGLSKEYATSQIKRSILWDKFLSEIILPTVTVGAEEVYEFMAYDSPENLQVNYFLITGKDKMLLAKQASLLKSCNDKYSKKIKNLEKKDLSVDKINDPHVRKAVITSAQGHPSYSFDYNNGYAFVFVCEKKSSKDETYANKILNQIKQNKVDKQAEYYLQNLAKTKFIEIKKFD